MAGLKKLFKNRFHHFRAGWRIVFYAAALVPLAKLLDLLGEWAPGAAERKRVLVDNPARLYGF